MRTSEFVLAQTVSLLAVTLILRLSGLSAGVIVLFAIAITVGPLLYLSLKAKKQRELFETQVPDSLLMLANALRAGQGFDQAMKVVCDDSPNPTSREFNRLIAQQRLGIESDIALQNLADRMKSESFDWVVMATLIQRRVGGNLAEVYERIAANPPGEG